VHHRREVLDGCTLASEQLAVDAQQSLERQEAFRLALRALDRLPVEKREIFLLYELEEVSMTEIARRVGVPLKTAFSRLYAARRELRMLLQKDGVCLGAWPLFWPRRAWQFWFEGARVSTRILPGIPAVAGSVVCCLLALVQGDDLNAALRSPRLLPMAANTAWQQPLAANAALQPTLATWPSMAPASAEQPQPAVVGPAVHRPARAPAKAQLPAKVEPLQLPNHAELELQVYRVGAIDLAPPRVLPFGFDEALDGARPRGIQLRGPLDAADGVERALR
jgi:hypothetical protein